MQARGDSWESVVSELGGTEGDRDANVKIVRKRGGLDTRKHTVKP